jgi:FkbM family methyltransferase
MQTLFDLVRNWRKIMRRRGVRERVQLLWAYTKLRLAFLPTKVGLTATWTIDRPGRLRLLGYTVELPAFYPCVLLFEEIFVDEVYAFDVPRGAPRILDCGAHVGLATLYFVRSFPDARVTAVEPDPQLFRILQRNIVANGLRHIDVRNAAVTGSDGPITFHTRNDFQGGAANSLDVRNIGPGVVARAITVQGIRLSAFLQSPVDLIKLDIEGAEGDVIAEVSAAGLLAATRWLIFEYHAAAGGHLGSVLTMLEEAGMAYDIRADGTGVGRPPGPQQLLMIRARRRDVTVNPASPIATDVP